MTTLDRAVKDFTRMMKAGNLDGIILYDLIEAYKHADDWDDLALKDALRKVIGYYATPYEYEEFEKEIE
jgi:hypothetical protein